LSDVAAPIFLALGEPKLLRYDRTTRLNMIVEKPSRISVKIKRGRSQMWEQRLVPNEECALVTECLNRLWIHFEQIGYIDAYTSRTERVGNVAINGKVTATALN